MSNIILSGDTSGSITITPAASGSGNITLPSVSGTLIANTVLAAGTNSQAPLTFSSGSNLTTAAAGSWEYDGRIPYVTPQGTQRGIMPSNLVYYLNSNRALSNDTSIQSIFNAGITLSANTVYEIQAQLVILATAGIASMAINLGFGGTATINYILYDFPYLINTSASTINLVDISPVQTIINTASMTAAAGSGSSEASSMTIHGTVSINAGGTFIPQMQYSVAPGVTSSVLKGSWFCLTPLGAAGANISVGTWA